MKRQEMMNLLGRIVRDMIAQKAGVHEFGRLKESFRFLALPSRVTVFSTYYWVRFVNDGRKAKTLAPGKQMVFFRDPQDDPRISSDYPKKRATRRKLTKAEFVDARAAGELIVMHSTPAIPGKHFIEAGIKEARKVVPKQVLKIFQEDVRKNIRRATNKVTVTLGI